MQSPASPLACAHHHHRLSPNASLSPHSGQPTYHQEQHPMLGSRWNFLNMSHESLNHESQSSAPAICPFRRRSRNSLEDSSDASSSTADSDLDANNNLVGRQPAAATTSPNVATEAFHLSPRLYSAPPHLKNAASHYNVRNQNITITPTTPTAPMFTTKSSGVSLGTFVKQSTSQSTSNVCHHMTATKSMPNLAVDEFTKRSAILPPNNVTSNWAPQLLQLKAQSKANCSKQRRFALRKAQSFASVRKDHKKNEFLSLMRRIVPFSTSSSGSQQQVYQVTPPSAHLVAATDSDSPYADPGFNQHVNVYTATIAGTERLQSFSSKIKSQETSRQVLEHFHQHYLGRISDFGLDSPYMGQEQNKMLQSMKQIRSIADGSQIQLWIGTEMERDDGTFKGMLYFYITSLGGEQLDQVGETSITPYSLTKLNAGHYNGNTQPMLNDIENRYPIDIHAFLHAVNRFAKIYPDEGRHQQKVVNLNLFISGVYGLKVVKTNFIVVYNLTASAPAKPPRIAVRDDIQVHFRPQVPVVNAHSPNASTSSGVSDINLPAALNSSFEGSYNSIPLTTRNSSDTDFSSDNVIFTSTSTSESSPDFYGGAMPIGVIMEEDEEEQQSISLSPEQSSESKPTKSKTDSESPHSSTSCTTCCTCGSSPCSCSKCSKCYTTCTSECEENKRNEALASLTSEADQSPQSQESSKPKSSSSSSISNIFCRVKNFANMKQLKRKDNDKKKMSKSLEKAKNHRGVDEIDGMKESSSIASLPPMTSELVNEPQTSTPSSKFCDNKRTGSSSSVFSNILHFGRKHRHQRISTSSNQSATSLLTETNSVSSIPSDLRLFGNSIPEQTEIGGNSFGFPFAIKKLLMAILLNQGLTTEGILRKSANFKQLKRLKELLERLHANELFPNCNYALGIDQLEASNPTEADTNKPYSLADDLKELNAFSVTDLAVALKKYLQELPNGILPSEHYTEWIKIGSQISQLGKSAEDQSDAVDIINSIRQLLGLEQEEVAKSPAITLLRYFLSLLYQIAQNSEQNLMTANNLAICVGPTMVVRPQQPVSPDTGRSHSVKVSSGRKTSSIQAQVQNMSRSAIELFASRSSLASEILKDQYESKLKGKPAPTKAESPKAIHLSCEAIDQPSTSKSNPSISASRASVASAIQDNTKETTRIAVLIQFLIEHCDEIFQSADDSELTSTLILQLADEAAADDTVHMAIVENYSINSSFEDDVFNSSFPDLTDGIQKLLIHDTTISLKSEPDRNDEQLPSFSFKRSSKHGTRNRRKLVPNKSRKLASPPPFRDDPSKQLKGYSQADVNESMPSTSQMHLDAPTIQVESPSMSSQSELAFEPLKLNAPFDPTADMDAEFTRYAKAKGKSKLPRKNKSKATTQSCTSIASSGSTTSSKLGKMITSLFGTNNSPKPTKESKVNESEKPSKENICASGSASEELRQMWMPGQFKDKRNEEFASVIEQKAHLPSTSKPDKPSTSSSSSDKSPPTKKMGLMDFVITKPSKPLPPLPGSSESDSLYESISPKIQHKIQDSTKSRAQSDSKATVNEPENIFRF